MEKKLSAERAAMIYAMEKIVRSLNNERAIETWLSIGLPDGDIEADYVDIIDGEILKTCNYLGELDFYSDDEQFADLMDTFLATIFDALSYENPSVNFADIKRQHILYSDGVTSHISQ